MAQNSLYSISEDSCKITLGFLLGTTAKSYDFQKTYCSVFIPTNDYSIVFEKFCGALRVDKESISNCSFSTFDV